MANPQQQQRLIALDDRRKILLKEVSDMEAHMDKLREEGHNKTPLYREIDDEREEKINELALINKEYNDIIQHIVNQQHPPAPRGGMGFYVPLRPPDEGYESGGSFIPSRGRTKLNPKIGNAVFGGNLGAFHWNSNIQHHLIDPVANVITKLAVPITSVVAPEAAPFISAGLKVGSAIANAPTKGGSFLSDIDQSSFIL